MFPELTGLAAETGEYGVRVYGHDLVLAALRGAVATERAAQAYLLAGPPAVGKGTVARWFAQLLLCQEAVASARPCGACRACRLVAQGAWPDLHEVAAPLRIEAARALQHDLALAPGESRHRVAILPNVELASVGAANSLLKTIEEPPRQAVLLLTTADLGAVLPTVRSRCQTFALRPLAVSAAADALVEGWDVTGEQALLLARLAGGRLGWAVQALSDDARLVDRTGWLDGLARAREADLADRLTQAGELARNGDRLPEVLAAWGSWWRDVLLWANGLGDGVVNRDRLPEIEAAAGRYAPRQVAGCLREIETALRRLAANAGAQLTLEVLMLELP